VIGEVRTCDECGKHMITQRRGARFCDDDCKNLWHNKHRRSQSATGKRLTPVEAGVGARGGNVRSVTEARQLQTASKSLDRWRLVMEVQIHRTLLGTGRFHVDDLDCLDLPAEAFGVRGTLVNAVRASGVMRSTGVTRKVAHKAANARKAPIYEITPQGRTELMKQHPTLVGLDTHNPEGTAGGEASTHSPAPSTGRAGEPDGITHGAGSSLSVESGEDGIGQLPGKSDHGRALASTAADAEPSELLSLDEARQPAPSAYDPWAA
jgi:hypothetical protein